MRRNTRVRALGAAVAALIVGLLVDTPAYANQTITVQGAINCPAGQILTAAKFTLTKVPSGQQISVQTALATTNKSPDNFANGTAIYNVTFDAKYQTATASVPSNWSGGSFTVSAPVCKTAIAPSVAARSSQPGITPIQVIATVKNQNGLMVTYRVSASGLGAQTVQVLAGQTQEVDFGPATCSTSYQVNAADADGYGTSGNASANTTACPPSPSPAQPSLPPSPSPSPSHMPSPSPSRSLASPSAAAVASLPADPSPNEGQGASPGPDTGAAATTNTSHGAGLFTLVNMLMCTGAMLVVIGAVAFYLVIRRSRRQAATF